MSDLKESKVKTITGESALTEPLLRPQPKVSKKDLEVKKRVDRLRFQPHPLERSGFLSSTLFWWVNPFLWVGNNGTLEQRVMPNVPKRDQVEPNERLLLEKFNQRGGIGKAIVALYKWNFLKNIFLMMLTQACFCSLALFLYFLINDIAEGKYSGDEKYKRYGLWYGCIVGTQLFGSLIINYIAMDFGRTGIRLKNTVIFSVYKKILRISVLNPNQHTEGNILNYVQGDCQKIEDSISKFSQILESIWQVIFGYSVCVFLIQFNVIALIVTFFVLTAFTLYLYKFIIRFEIQFMVAKDKKLQLLKNVLKNLKYIKMKVWENYYHAKLFLRREEEISALKKSNFVFGTVFFLNWINPTTALVVAVASMLFFNADTVFKAARILAFMKILTTILRGMSNIPACVQFFVELKVSLKRLNTFMDADELQTKFIEQAVSRENPLALEMEFGNFFWNKLDEKQMAARREKARSDRKKIRGRIKKVEQKISSPDDLLLQNDQQTVSHMMSVASEGSFATQSVSSVSKVRQRTLVGSLREGADSKIAFQLKDIDLAIPKGQLTMIFGEIGCGKSSLFYSLLGEMNQKFEEPGPKLRINGSVGFMSQKPWLMAKTIKENIILDLPYDQDRFDLAVRSSALDDDLKLFADKENRMLGENGENVSGGQRTRIELARMIYQK